MALPQPKHSFLQLCRASVLPVLILCVALQSCSKSKKVFKSVCDIDKPFTQVTFNHLMDSMKEYDQKYVEISGKYEEDKELSALFCDSMFVDHSHKNALWVDFSPDCPLYLTGTHVGLFEYNDGKFTQINNRSVVIRGRMNLNNKGHLKQYKGTIERVSLIKL